jgi:hypothetical protein
MRALTTLFTALLLSSSIHADQEPATSTFDRFFSDKTMRVDYFHTGGHDTEIVALDRVVSDGPWPGSRTQLIDELNLGKYHFDVIDRETNRVLYSRGFASIYGEWETTADARQRHQTFHESLRFPWPQQPVQVVLKKRDDQNAFQQLWSTVIDPNSRFVNPADIQPVGRSWSVLDNGHPSTKVDILLIGDGYSDAEREKLERDVARASDALFRYEPFRSRKSDFNVRAIHLPAAESGVHRPRTSEHRRTLIGTAYNIFDSERYILTYDNRAMRDVASGVPYEFIIVLVNERQYGGGGIYNFQSTAAMGSSYADYLIIHEFGHHFAALADEYYTSPVAYATGAAVHPEPWEPNVTALHDPAQLKWRDLVTPGTPIPTPWLKEEFEKRSRAVQAQRAELRAQGAPEEEMERLFDQQKAWETKFLASMQYSGRVGAFEGADYEATGKYRPEADCVMFTRNEVGFCRVCHRAINRVIDQYSR